MGRPESVPVATKMGMSAPISTATQRNGSAGRSATRDMRSERSLVTGAWIEVLVAQRALKGLERERPAPGDRVEVERFGQTSVGTVSSIGAEGQVYLRGTMSPRIAAHRVKVVARAVDEGTQR